MSEDYLEVAPGLVPPASPKAGFLGNLWKGMTTCESYEIFPSLEMCSMLRKYENDTLFTGFLLLFFALLISAIYYTISLEEIKDLTVIRNKVKISTDTLDKLMRAFWNLKQIKIKKLRMKAERKKANRVKIPSYMFSYSKKFKGAAIAAFVDLNSIISKPEIFYTHEDEFPIERDCISLSRISSENTSLIVSEQLCCNNQRKEIGGEILPPSPPSIEFKSWKDKEEQHNLPSNNVKSTKKNGIFCKRKKIQEKDKPTKNMDQVRSKNKGSENFTPRSNKTSRNISRTPKEPPKKSGIFNKSKSQPRLEVLNRHKNI